MSKTPANVENSPRRLAAAAGANRRRAPRGLAGMPLSRRTERLSRPLAGCAYADSGEGVAGPQGAPEREKGPEARCPGAPSVLSALYLSRPPRRNVRPRNLFGALTAFRRSRRNSRSSRSRASASSRAQRSSSDSSGAAGLDLASASSSAKVGEGLTASRAAFLTQSC